MIERVFMGHDIRLWLIETNQRPQYESYAWFWRVVREKGKQARLFLVSYLPLGKALLEFPAGAVVELHAGPCRDPREYIPENLLFRFENCTVHRTWIGSKTAGPGGDDVLKVYLELRGDEVNV